MLDLRCLFGLEQGWVSDCFWSLSCLYHSLEWLFAKSLGDTVVFLFEGDLPDLRTVLFYLIYESRLTKRGHLLFYLLGKRNNENKRKVIESDGIIFGYFIICVAHISGKYRVNWWMLCLSTWSHNRLFAEKLNKNDRKNKAEIIMCETVGAKC